MTWTPMLERPWTVQGPAAGRTPGAALHRELAPVAGAPRVARHDPDAQRLLAGLARPQATLPAQLLYDETGREWLDTLGELPEHEQVRAEDDLMHAHAREMADEAGARDVLLDLAAGACAGTLRLATLFDAEHVVAVDGCPRWLEEGRRVLRAGLPWARVQTHVADPTVDLGLPVLPAGRRLIALMGSAYGRFAPQGAETLLARLRASAGDEAALLIGVDLVQDAALMEAAWDDAIGVAAMLNRHALERANAMAGTDFVLDDWEHEARWDGRHSRIELRLVARHDLWVEWPGGQRRFRAGEAIETAHRYRTRPDRLAALLRRAGWTRHRLWTDAARGHAVLLAQA